MSNVEQEAISKEHSKLKYFSSKTNSDIVKDTEDNLLINLSLRKIAANISKTIISIINELLDPENKRSVVEIFFTGDRMMYLGIVLIILMFSIYIIDVSGN